MLWTSLIHSLAWARNGHLIFVYVSELPKKQRTTTNVKLTIHHRLKTKVPHLVSLICRSPSVETKPNRPHISSDTINFKERRDKNFGSAWSCLARPPLDLSLFVTVWSVTVCLVPSGEGCLGLHAEVRKSFFSNLFIFFKDRRFTHKNKGFFCTP